jgi:hypothetical protein
MGPASTQAEERKYGQDHHDQADQINDAVHSTLLLDAFGAKTSVAAANWLRGLE